MSRKLDHARARQQREADRTERDEARLVRAFVKAAAPKPQQQRPRRRPVRSAWDPEPR